jgi:thiol:disulfide interchange protein/DsbC/DsbD-like thiol-disulfide interchange protein
MDRRSALLLRGVLALLVLLLLPLSAARAQEDETPYSSAELISEVTTIQPGTPFTLALRLTLEPHWHTYWENAGDSGIPVTIDWDLPTGFEAGEIQWPYPMRIDTPPLVSYAYEDEVLLLTTITPPADLPVGQPATIAARADWLVCADVCLPAGTDLSISLNTLAGEPWPDPRWQQAFIETRRALPQTVPGFDFQAFRQGNGVRLVVTPPPGRSAPGAGTEFFVADEAVLDHLPRPDWTLEGRAAWADFAPSDYVDGPITRLRGVLVAPEGEAWDEEGQVRALLVDVEVEEGPAGVGAAADAADPLPPTIWLALLLAFLGGLALNLMPCVFPILSVKILSFVNQAGEEAGKVRAHGLAFGSGVLMSFWALAGLLLILRAGGAVSGWGFQLQSPAFVAVMTLLLFAIGLNLMGVFEIGLSFAGVGGHVANKGGYGGSFSSGILATLIATPCTAPFMGTALGFALTQTSAVALLIFTFLGLGMATPYVVLSFSPRLMKHLPRPGGWMETFRQVLAFPMFATAIWLLWVFGMQMGVDGMSRLLVALLLLSFGAWMIGRWSGVQFKAGVRNFARVAGVSAIIAAVAIAVSGTGSASVAAMAAAEGEWEVYSAARVEELRAEGRPVFIDFTAAWCLTCQVNKRVALSAPEIEQAFRDRGITLMRADWTSRDDEITRALESYGRSGVPLYILYPNGSDEPVLLPEVLTRKIVLDYLARVPEVRQAAR